MSAINKVLEGKYKDYNVLNTFGTVAIWKNFGDKNIEIDRNLILDYSLVDESYEESFGRQMTRGIIGDLLFGPAGFILGSSTAKQKGIHRIILRYYDGEVSLLEVNEKIYESIQNNLPYNKNDIIKPDLKDITDIQLEKLKKLKEMFDLNIINKEEFEKNKIEILDIKINTKKIIKNLVINDFGKFFSFFSKDKPKYLLKTKLNIPTQAALHKTQLPCVAVRNINESEEEFFIELLTKNNVSFDIVEEVINLE